MYQITNVTNGIAAVDGFYCGAVNVGLRPIPEQGDVAFIRSEKLCDISAVFTTNKFQAAPIEHYKRYPLGFKTDFVLINAKNANAMTGKQGVDDIDLIFDNLLKTIQVTNPVMSSTGVIGYRLPVEQISSAFRKFDFSSRESDQTAKAIMTTDKFKKELACRVELPDGSSFSIAAICKGAGMINPAMATMLCFIVTDADMPRGDMDELLQHGVERSFNRISVDGDTSTNDTVMLLCNHESGAYDKQAFAETLNKIMFELSMMILRDGEGSNKVVAFDVRGAQSADEAKKASVALSNSLLVKTALFGEDPNWGRIASTIGACGIECDEKKLRIFYDDLLIYSDACRELDDERENMANQIMKQDSFRVVCDLGIGDESYTSYGCDLSYEYVKINAEYRT